MDSVKMSGGKPLKDALYALKEVIKSQQEAGKEHEPTPTEFFAVVVFTLKKNGSEWLLEMLKVLAAVIPNTASAVLRMQFESVAELLLEIVKAYADENKLESDSNRAILNAALAALGTFLQYQDRSDGFWKKLPPHQCINALLMFIDSSKYSRLRRTVNDQLLALLNSHLKHNATYLRSFIADFCLGVIRECNRHNYQRTHFVIMFLEYALVTIPASQVVPLIEMCLGLQVVGIPKLTAAVYRMFDAFFQNPHYAFSAEVTASIIRILIQNRPSTADMESNTYYCTALASGLTVLLKSSRVSANGLLIKVLGSLAAVCDSEFTQVHCAVGTGLKRITCAFVDASFVKAVSGATGGQEERALLGKMLPCIEVLFSLKFQAAWLFTLDSVRSLFDSFRGVKPAADLLASTIDTIARLYQGIETQVINVPPSIHIALADTLGCILRSCGVVNFLKHVPLLVSSADHVVPGMQTSNLGIESCREWIISILHSNLKLMPCALADFGIAILPVVRKCIAASRQSELNAAQVKMTRNRVLQLWSLLPEICSYNCTDIATNFQKLADEHLHPKFEDYEFPELVSHVVNSLTHLARGVKERCANPTVAATPEYSTVQSFAQGFIARVVNWLEGIDQGDGRFQEGLSCLTALVSIAPEKVVSKFSSTQLKVILTPSMNGENDMNASKSMAIVMNIIPQLPKSISDNVLYQTIEPMLTHEHVALQKRAYAILDELLTSHPDIVYRHKTPLQLVVQIHESLLTCHVSSRNMRFRCLVSLLKSMVTSSGEDEEQEELTEKSAADLKAASDLILGEVLICQKDANKKSRDAALEILKLMIRHLSPLDLLMQLCSALVGETSVMRSSAVTAMCMLMLGNRDNQQLVTVCLQLIPTVCMLLQEQSADQTKAVLSYIKVCSSVFPKELVLQELPTLIGAFTSELGSQKSKFSSRCRGILRKLHHRLGEEVLREHVPDSDMPLLDYICKQQRRADRKREKRNKSNEDKMLGSDSEDSSDDEGEDGEEGMDVDGGDDRVDYRLAARPKAIRARDTHQLALGSNIPTSLGDLLEDQTPVNYSTARPAAGDAASSSGKRSSSCALKARAAASAAVVNARPDDEDEDYSVAVTADGRVVIKERPVEAAPVAVKPVESAAALAEKKAAQSGSEERQSKKRKLNLKEPGEEYRSKKAGGDVWKKGMLEPHAYIPLDARLFSRKNYDQAVSHFGVVVKSGRKTQQEKDANFRGRHKVTNKR